MGSDSVEQAKFCGKQPVGFSTGFRSSLMLFSNGAIVLLEDYTEEQSHCLAKKLKTKDI